MDSLPNCWGCIICFRPKFSQMVVGTHTLKIKIVLVEVLVSVSCAFRSRNDQVVCLLLISSIKNYKSFDCQALVSKQFSGRMAQ
jgi:hypothetical protein